MTQRRERTLFHNSSPPRWLHRRDIRMRGAAFLLLQVALWAGDVRALPPLLIMILVLYRSCGLRLRATLHALRPLLWLAAMVVLLSIIQHWAAYRLWLVRPLTLPQPVLESLLIALRYAARLIMSALVANLFLCTATSGQIIDGLEWLFRPVGRPGRALALMGALTLTIVDRYLSALWYIRAALWCRRLAPQRAPLRAIRCYAMLLMRALEQQSHTLTKSLYLRRYGDWRSSPRFKPTMADWWLVLATTMVCALALGGHLIY